jgi:hypothetical protein
VESVPAIPWNTHSGLAGGTERNLRDGGLGPDPGQPGSEGADAAAQAFGSLATLFARPMLAQMAGGGLQDLKHASVLKMEATLKDGEDPLITVELQGSIKGFIDAC